MAMEDDFREEASRDKGVKPPHSGEGNQETNANRGTSAGGRRQGGPESELLEQLYRRYAKGGTRIARIRGSAYFLFKKYSWIWVTEFAYFLKRVLDIVTSSVMLVLLAPLFLVTALAIKIDNPGPVFYKQVRVGKWGKLFTIYKFRSMIVGADKIKDQLLDQNESGGVIFKMKRDPRITRTGRIIRKLSIDELPQLWNVLKGDMSLVGPRPPVPREVAEYEYADRRRLDAIPGITCIWQVSGRSEIDFEGQVRLDVQYIENQSFWGDIKILLKTVPAVVLGKGAY
jgi:exopolysaccharide biosynthesis polyprenyl glycosylphosphotransferase